MNQIKTTLLLLVGILIGALATGGPSPPPAGESATAAASRASVATAGYCTPRPRVVQKGPVIGRKPAPTRGQLTWMARVMYVEAASTYEMLRVGQTVLNRVRSERHPNTIRAVATEDWAYTGVHVDLMDVSQIEIRDAHTPRWREAVRAAHAILTLPQKYHPLPPGTRHYFSPHALREAPDWANKQKMVLKLGDRFEFYAGIHPGTEFPNKSQNTRNAR